MPIPLKASSDIKYADDPIYESIIEEDDDVSASDAPEYMQSEPEIVHGAPIYSAQSAAPVEPAVPEQPANPPQNSVANIGKNLIDLKDPIQKGTFDKVPDLLDKLPGQGSKLGGASRKILGEAKNKYGQLDKIAEGMKSGTGALRSNVLSDKGTLKGVLNTADKLVNEGVGSAAKQGVKEVGKRAATDAIKKGVAKVAGKGAGTMAAGGASTAAGGAAAASAPVWVTVLLIVICVILGISLIIGVTSCASSMFNSSSEEQVVEQDDLFIPTVKMADPKTVCDDTDTSGSNPSGSKVTEREDCIEVDTSSAALGEWTYYNQVSPNWDTLNDGVDWGSGCGVVACAMVLTSYSKDAKYTPTYLAKNGLSQGNEITPAALAGYVNQRTDEFHLKVSDADRSGGWKEEGVWDRIKDICAKGGCVIVGQDTISTSAGHYIVLRKIENGTITYADPATGAEGTCVEKKFLEYGYSNNGTTQCIFFEKV